MRADRDLPIAVLVRKPRPSCAALARRIAEVAALKRRYGYRRIHIHLKREGWHVNRKRVYRLYREAGLAVRRRKRKHVALGERKPLPKPEAVNLSWSMDFMSDCLADGRRLRCLTLIDGCSRECLTLKVDTSITGKRVVRSDEGQLYVPLVGPGIKRLTLEHRSVIHAFFRKSQKDSGFLNDF